jgi:murein DD-endopeptidase MepM/ murein hydrolase activator NlpD
MRRLLRVSLPLLIVPLAALGACQATGAPEAVARRRAADIVLARETTLVKARVTAGATLASILRAHGVAVAEVADAITEAMSVFDLRKVRADQPYELEKAIGGALRRFEYEIDGNRFLRVARGSDARLVANVLPIPKTRRVELVSGRIDRESPSLVAAMDAAGETIDLTLAMADIFGGEIDFSTELQPDDTFQLSVEKQYRDGGAFAGYGPILAAEFVNNGRRVRAVRFRPEGGSPGYYDERGVSMKRFFLASPLKFQPIVTSGFSRSRFHPILHEYHAHLGIDYRAPIGSPVVAVSDGVVVSAGMSGGSGNLVHLRHSNGFETEYLHLSSIAVRAGAHVRQGEVVGRVGMTGLATGPHLDYRVRKNGAFINPLAAHRAMPAADPVPRAQMAAFAATRDGALATLGGDAFRVKASRIRTAP